MPLTASEKSRRYRERLKINNPDKYAELKKKAAKRATIWYRKKIAEITPEDKQELLKKWRTQNKHKINRLTKQDHGKLFLSGKETSSYFTKEGRGWRCRLCRAVVSYAANLKTHLEEQHSGEQANSCDDQDNGEEVYTEEVYLEDELIDIKEEPTSHEETREIASASANGADKTPVIAQQNDEIELFGTYMVSLLRTLPKAVCSKLQLEIMNKIMTEKIKFDCGNGLDKMAGESVVQDIDMTDPLVRNVRSMRLPRT